MGGCISRDQDIDENSHRNENRENLLANGNKKLIPFSNYKWKSDVPLTMEDIIKKREEFWLTSPSYDGRQEIWQALKACCETDSLDLAQAIVDSAGISVPTGSLVDGCYDELGNQYVLPNFCIIEPTNLVKSDNDATKPLLSDTNEGTSTISNDKNNNSKKHSRSNSTNNSKNNGNNESEEEEDEESNNTKALYTIDDEKGGVLITTLAMEAGGEEGVAKEVNISTIFRLSTNKDIKMIINNDDTVKTIQRCIIKHQGLNSQKTNVRIVIKGKILEGSQILSESYKSSSTPLNVVQVFISQKE